MKTKVYTNPFDENCSSPIKEFKDLVSLSEKACISIYNMYTEQEIENAPIPSVIYDAWVVGNNLVKENNNAL